MDIGGKHLFRPHGILAGKAGGAETAFCVFGKLLAVTWLILVNVNRFVDV